MMPGRYQLCQRVNSLVRVVITPVCHTQTRCSSLLSLRNHIRTTPFQILLLTTSCHTYYKMLVSAVPQISYQDNTLPNIITHHLLLYLLLGFDEACASINIKISHYNEVRHLHSRLQLSCSSLLYPTSHMSGRYDILY